MKTSKRHIKYIGDCLYVEYFPDNKRFELFMLVNDDGKKKSILNGERMFQIDLGQTDLKKISKFVTR